MSDTDLPRTDDDASSGEEPRGEREGWSVLELAAAILLGIAGLLTAYATYQGALADGNSLESYTQSTTLNAEANGFFNDGVSIFNADQALFLEYQILVEQGDPDTAGVIRDNLWDPRLVVAWEAWLEFPEGVGPATPLDTDAYVVEQFQAADELFAEAAAAFDAGSVANKQGDQFELASVYFAVALFFAGIATLFKGVRLQIALLIGAFVFIVPGAIQIGRGKGWI
jgi:hypothetical protein